jgi:DMSO/TMAO reductase YedYZ heme-binding membrane subunit
MLACVVFYLYLYTGVITLRVINQSAAWTSVLLIGLSFVLSGLCYFLNAFDHLLPYRKHIGLSGFFYALGHAGLTLYLLSQRTNLVTYFIDPEHFWPLVFGMSALLVFAFMTAISNQLAIHRLGAKLWRGMLRFGYIGVILAVGHFYVIGGESWSEWLRSMNSIPPFGIIALAFSLFVLILRVILEIDVRVKRSKT